MDSLIGAHGGPHRIGDIFAQDWCTNGTVYSAQRTTHTPAPTPSQRRPAAAAITTSKHQASVALFSS
eukprot:scaffold27372_cov137-Isochrysis_galbana.AAC.4